MMTTQRIACSRCRGTGKVHTVIHLENEEEPVRSRAPGGRTTLVLRVCPECHGTGKAVLLRRNTVLP